MQFVKFFWGRGERESVCVRERKKEREREKERERGGTVRSDWAYMFVVPKILGKLKNPAS
jgi:hypothetical protein